MVNDDETRPPWRVITGGVDGRIRYAHLPPSHASFDIHISQSHATLHLIHNVLLPAPSPSRSPAPLFPPSSPRRRVWNVHSSYQAMLVSLKEHRKDVTSIAVTPDNRSFVSSSADGSCIIWDLVRYTLFHSHCPHCHMTLHVRLNAASSHHMSPVLAFWPRLTVTFLPPPFPIACRLVRVGAVFAQTIFEGVVFHPDSSQILTCGSNNKVHSHIYDHSTIKDSAIKSLGSTRSKATTHSPSPSLDASKGPVSPLIPCPSVSPPCCS